jgi:Tfp pilus assembly protein PilO
MTRSRIWNLGTAVVVVLVLLAGWFLLISPQRSAAAESRTAAEAAAQQNAVTEGKIRALKLAQKDVPLQIAKIEEIRRQLPVEASQPALLRQLAGIARVTNIDLSNISPAPIATLEGVEGVKFIPMELTATGTFSGLKDFLDALERNNRALVVTGFNISPPETGPADAAKSPDKLAITVKTRVFMSDPAAAAPADAPGALGAANGAASTPSSTTETN